MNAAKPAPQDAEAQYQLALAYLQLRDYAKAVASLQKAIELNSKHTGAQLKLAELMAAAGKKDTVEGAKERLTTILCDSPDNTEAATALSITEARLGDPEDAIKNLEQALQRAPADLQASVTLARLKLSQKDQAGAEEVLDTAVKQAPKSVDAALAIAQFYVATKSLDKAEAEARRAVQLDPKSENALLMLAYVQVGREADRSGGADLSSDFGWTSRMSRYMPFT